MRHFDQVPQVHFAADVLTQAKMIGDFIAEFTWESCSDRQKPERIHPQPSQLIEPCGNVLEAMRAEERGI